jgi:Sortase domain
VRLIVAACLLLSGVFGVGIGLGTQTGLPLFNRSAKAPPGEFPVLDPSPPKRIRIPSIGVDAPVHAVGKERDGSIAVPALHLRNEAGWYREGPSPGEYGPAILVGHVDTKDKPAVFHRLNEAAPGAKIEITRRDRTVAVFEVNSVEQFDKRKLPASKVYRDYSRPALRLITCGGNWVGGETGYADNIIVFASLISSRRA